MPRYFNGEKRVLSKNGAKRTEYSHANPYLTLCAKTNLKWVHSINKNLTHRKKNTDARWTIGLAFFILVKTPDPKFWSLHLGLMSTSDSVFCNVHPRRQQMIHSCVCATRVEGLDFAPSWGWGSGQLLAPFVLWSCELENVRSFSVCRCVHLSLYTCQARK